VSRGNGIAVTAFLGGTKSGTGEAFWARRLSGVQVFSSQKRSSSTSPRTVSLDRMPTVSEWGKGNHRQIEASWGWWCWPNADGAPEWVRRVRVVRGRRRSTNATATQTRTEFAGACAGRISLPGRRGDRRSHRRARHDDHGASRTGDGLGARLPEERGRRKARGGASRSRFHGTWHETRRESIGPYRSSWATEAARFTVPAVVRLRASCGRWEIQTRRKEHAADPMAPGHMSPTPGRLPAARNVAPPAI